MSDSDKVKDMYVIGRGLAGWHGQGINVSRSGGDLQDHPWWAGGIQYGLLANAVDGCLVYDAEHADYAAFTRLIISGPMVDPKLAPGTVKALDSELRAAARRMLPAMSGGMKTLAKLAVASPTYSGLDTVSVDIYRRLLETVPGMKIGTVRNGAIEWSDGTRTERIPCEPRVIVTKVGL